MLRNLGNWSIWWKTKTHFCTTWAMYSCPLFRPLKIQMLPEVRTTGTRCWRSRSQQ